MTQGPVVVVGSVNVDMMLRCRHLPRAGETVMGRDFAIAPGGKGANQAVAAARMGAEVVFLGAVGDDAFAASALRTLVDEGVDVRHVQRIPRSGTGVAVVLTEEGGENCIALAPGANALLEAVHVEALASVLQGAAMLLCQLESPLETVERAIEVACRHRVPVLLNPAPARPIPTHWLPQVDLLVPNALEAAALCGRSAVNGVADALEAAEQLQAGGARRVIVTLGSQGVVVAAPELRGHFAAPAVEAVDTTGAGDTFVGAVAAALVQGLPLAQATALAQQAAAFSVTRRGAQAGMPRLADLPRSPEVAAALERSVSRAPGRSPGEPAVVGGGDSASATHRL